jgi:lysozyme family protein
MRKMVFSDGKNLAYVTERCGLWQVKIPAKRGTLGGSCYSYHRSRADAIRLLFFRNFDWRRIR